MTWFMFDSFCACNSIAVLRIAQGKTTRMFPKQVILICAMSDTQNSEFFWQNSSIGEWTFVLQCLSCQDSAAAKIWVEMYVWIAEFQFIVLHDKIYYDLFFLFLMFFQNNKLPITQLLLSFNGILFDNLVLTMMYFSLN